MSEGNVLSFSVSGVILCQTCKKPTMYNGAPPGPELCDCWKKVSDHVYIKAEDVIGLREFILKTVEEITRSAGIK